MSVNNKLLTIWGEKINREKPLDVYPRPQLERDFWQNLNGVWKYIINDDEKNIPKDFKDEIIVPFSPETILSEVDRILMPNQVLWYELRTTIDSFDKGGQIILHFGAVDQVCSVYVNNQLVGKNEGGYWPFSFDISKYIFDENITINVSVKDYSNQGESSYGHHAYGKQSLKRGGIWYTPQSGIWQTVWIEKVPKNYIKSLKITPDFDNSKVDFLLNTSSGKENVSVKVFEKENLVLEKTFDENHFSVELESFINWSPENPFLYDVFITYGEDEIKTYFGMRKFSVVLDENNIKRLGLNNKPYFHNGLLDQGYWSDGMYTPPSDEAMIYDIEKLKDLGFNMLRKHIKIEPLRWYYHCDRLGMIVWQDFISGGGPYSPLVTQLTPFVNKHLDDSNYSMFGRKDLDGRVEFEKEMIRTMDLLHNTVSLSVWVPFNEGWGQFDSLEIERKVRALDDTRLVDHASGWHDQGGGDFNSPHVYYKKFKMKKDDRIQILSEFGGYSYPVEGHISSDKLFGYRMYEDKASFTSAYVHLYETEIVPAIKNGLSATVYTQVSDVEDEINGVFTYDRKVLKIDEEELKKINKKLSL